MTVPMQYEQLTQEQRDFLLTGCGPGKFWGSMVPELIFHDACQRHDFDYWLGFTSEDRYRADRRFLMTMLAASDKAAGTGWSSWFKRRWYRAMAWRYYAAVRALGGPAFTYRECYATADDLAEEMRATTA